LKISKQIVLLLILLGSWVRAETLQVRHDHNPWGKCEGELTLSEEGMEYSSDKKEHSRTWKWVGIQSFDRKSPSRFSILTYEDQRWGLGTDRHYNFTFLSEQQSLGEETFQLISRHLNTPITDRIVKGVEADYRVAAKHLHTFGGCEGTLHFSREWIVYETNHEKDARTWKRDRDVESVWSLNRYQLEIQVMEENKREFDKTRRFRFQLKEPLDQNYYDQLRREFLPGS
jgi:hypothetical protein